MDPFRSVPDRFWAVHEEPMATGLAATGLVQPLAELVTWWAVG
jgi:hypothetical protein